MGSDKLKVNLKRLIYETNKVKMFKLFIILLGQAALLKSFPTNEATQLIKTSDDSFSENFGITNDEFEEKKDEFTKLLVRKPRSTDLDHMISILKSKSKNKKRHKKKGRKNKKNKKDRKKKRKHKKNKNHDERRYKKRDLKGRKKKHNKRVNYSKDKELSLVEVLDKVEQRPNRRNSEKFDESRKNYWKYQNRNTRNLGGKSKSNTENYNKFDDIDSSFYQFDDTADSKTESKCIFYDSISGRCLQEVANHGCLYGDPEDGGLFGCDD